MAQRHTPLIVCDSGSGDRCLRTDSGDDHTRGVEAPADESGQLSEASTESTPDELSAAERSSIRDQIRADRREIEWKTAPELPKDVADDLTDNATDDLATDTGAW
ncbi:MAG: hypothetical protein ABEK29_04220, partial [Bradymonadaceae bacterium]